MIVSEVNVNEQPSFDYVENGIVFASTNKSKLSEYRLLMARLTANANSTAVKDMADSKYEILYSRNLADKSIMVLSPEDVGIDLFTVDESGKSLLENAQLKARSAYNQLHRPCFADDSGIWINGIGGPGVFTGRFAEDHKNMKKAIEQYKMVQEYFMQGARLNSGVTASTVICLITEDGEEHFFSGSVCGVIKSGIDVCFYDELDNTDPAYKNIMIPKQGVSDCNSTTFSFLDENVYHFIGPKHNAMVNMLKFLDDTNRLLPLRKGGETT